MMGQMLAPAAALIAWSLVMLLWMTFTRLPAMKKANIDMGAAPGGRGQDLEGVLPPSVNWKAHNYSHLMEQPTIFYPAVIIIALMGAGAMDVLAAWAYVALRILHSIWQSTVNVVPVRFLLFLLATIALFYLAWRAFALTVLGGAA